MVLTHIDFAENYTFEMQNEIQSMYYYSDQVSILVQVTYSVDFGELALGGPMQLKRETHFYISDDKHHDTDFASIAFSYTGGGCNLMDLRQQLTISSAMAVLGNSKVQKLCILLLGEHLLHTGFLPHECTSVGPFVNHST